MGPMFCIHMHCWQFCALLGCRVHKLLRSSWTCPRLELPFPICQVRRFCNYRYLFQSCSMVSRLLQL
ncbi:hypothetical protein M758_4G099600 [Ceratodon purpureus]|nr:hypothetical protein M758_4G099600 [Ceratodon purpureus]